MSKLTVVGSINADLIVHAERHPHPVSYTKHRAHETPEIISYYVF